MQAIHSDNAPQIIGPYSQAIRTGNLLYCSGQTPIDPATMTVRDPDIVSQTERVMQNLAMVLYEAGLSFQDVVKTNVFLTDMKYFANMNTVYGKYFGHHKPARSTVAVLALPLQALVEIECIAEYKNPDA